MSEFLRVLRPGGRIVMFEYSRTPEAQLAPGARDAFKMVCDLAAMPAWYRLNHGDLERLLSQTGLAVGSATDVTSKILPMLHAFAILGSFPYFIGRVSGRTEKIVNALSGVEMWRHQNAWRYNIYVASKPG